MKAFHNDPEIKEKYVSRLKAHHDADEIVKGTGYRDSHGCAVGCTLNKYDHAAYENELGLPEWLAHLEDAIFESLPPIEAQQFAVDFLAAIPVGADVSNVCWQLASKRHRRDKERIGFFGDEFSQAMDLVIEYCDSDEKTETMRAAAAQSAWSAAQSAESAALSAAARWAARSARSAAESAAWSAESAAQWAAARSARSAESAAESAALSAQSAAQSAAASAAALSALSAAQSAAASAARWAAWSAHYQWEAKTLLELLRQAR